MKFESLPDTTKALPLGPLHLKLRTFSILTERGITTIGQLNALVSGDFAGLDNLSPTAIKDSLHVMTHFSGSINMNGDVDWLRFWTGLGVTILPAGYSHQRSRAEITKSLPIVIKQVLSHENPSDRNWLTVQRRFGLEKAKRLTLDELGRAFGVTRQGIRQIETVVLSELREVLVENKYINKKYHVHPDIIALIRDLSEAVTDGAKGFALETELLQRAESVLGQDPEEYLPILYLFFDLFGFSRVNIETYESTPIWEYRETGERKLLEEVIGLIDALLTQKHPAPMDELDVLVNINDRLRVSKPLTKIELRRFLELCGSVERRPDGRYQGKFEELKPRANQAERILIEENRPLHVKEISRRINARIVGKGKRKVQPSRIGNIMTTDGRFAAIGRSGFRGLKSWKGLESGSIRGLMEEFLISVNRPATKEEIYAYLAQRRPVSKNSVSMYLERKDTFRKAGFQKWGLASWAETEDALTWSPEQVADFVANIFKQRRAKELEFKILTRALVQAAGISSNQARGMLRFNCVISSRREERPFKIVAILNPSYKKDLKTKFKIKRKTETQLQRAEKIVQGMLDAAENNQVELSKLVEELKTKHGFHEKTAYQYISKMDFVEKIDLPVSGSRICQTKGTKGSLSHAHREFAPKPDDREIVAMIGKGESATLEFKSSARWDMKQNKADKLIEAIVVKTVAALLNSKGGALLLGIDDDRNVIGLAHDYKLFGKKDSRDAYENFLTSLLLNNLGRDSAALISITFHELDGKDVGKVEAKKSPKPVFVKDANAEHLYIRAGNSTRQLNARETVDYCKMHWAS